MKNASRWVSLGAAILGLGLAGGCLRQAQQAQPPSQAPQVAQPAGKAIEQPGKGFDIKVASVTRAKRYENLKLKELGVSTAPGLVATPGHELAIVRISLKQTTEGATLRLGINDGQGDEKERDWGRGVRQLGFIRAYDADGTRYRHTVMGQSSVGYEFVFVVPAGTPLRKLELAEGLSLDLK